MSRRPTQHARTVSFASITSISPKAMSSFLVPMSILLGIAAASATQTEVAHSLVVDQHYNQPYFTFFLTHITFSLVFPIHLLVLRLVNRKPIALYLDDIRAVISNQLGEDHHTPWSGIAWKWSTKISGLTWLISAPALSWFVAMLFTSALDVTAIYASSAFFAYFFSMILLKQPLSRVTLGSIALAFSGVLVISLAGDGEEGGEGQPSNRTLGDLVMLFGAVLLGLYEVVYKMALPEGHGGVDSPTDTSDYESLPTHQDDIDDIPLSTGSTIPTITETSPPDSPPDTPIAKPYSNSKPHVHYAPGIGSGMGNGQPPSYSDRRSTDSHRPPAARKSSRSPLLDPISIPPVNASLPDIDNEDHSPMLRSGSGSGSGSQFRRYSADEPPVLPTALHSNFITSCIGFATLIMLWVPIVVLHYTDIESFRWPGSQGGDGATIWWGLAVVALCGAIYNAGLMVLIGIWGPTTSSVANLLTIGLVAITDAVWIGHIPDFQTLMGVGMICIGFGVLLWEGEG